MKKINNEVHRNLLASEMEVLRLLKHNSHILDMHSIYTTKNNTYIITELCESDLSRKIKKKLTEQEVFHYMSKFING